MSDDRLNWRARVIYPKSQRTRDPNAHERVLIAQFVAQFYEATGGTPRGEFDVDGVEGMVLFLAKTITPFDYSYLPPLPRIDDPPPSTEPPA